MPRKRPPYRPPAPAPMALRGKAAESRTAKPVPVPPARLRTDKRTNHRSYHEERSPHFKRHHPGQFHNDRRAPQDPKERKCPCPRNRKKVGDLMIYSMSINVLIHSTTRHNIQELPTSTDTYTRNIWPLNQEILAMKITHW